MVDEEYFGRSDDQRADEGADQAVQPADERGGNAFRPMITSVPSSPASQAISIPAMPPVNVASPQASA